MLKNLNLEFEYNTSDNNIVKEFYEPCLSNSIIYKRGVGFFTSGWLTENSKGLARFIENGGKAQYITSPIIDEKDLESLKGNFDQEKVTKTILSNIDELEKSLAVDTRNLLGWLVYDEIIEFKFAVLKNKLENGDFHTKFGVFIDSEKNIVSFIGSMNESIKGFMNYEEINVFTSWQDQTSLNNCKSKLKRFDRIWANEDPNIEVYEINSLIKNRLIELKSYGNRPYSKSNNKIKDNTPSIPLWLDVRDYQKDAINNWLSNGGKGILSMATGSGKTLTSLIAATMVISNSDKIVLVVIVPQNHLLEQWTSEMYKFNINPIKCNSNYPNWHKDLNSKITQFNFNEKYFLPIITTNGTYITEKFQNLIKKLDNIFLLVDEAHNFGSQEIRKFYLKENVLYKLGLSATPQRHMDDEGTNELVNYFDKVVFEYPLKKAIEDGNLTPYYYFPIFVNLTEEEQAEFYELSEQISKQMNFKNKNDESNDYLKMLLIKRAKVIESASNKLIVLKELLSEEKYKNLKNFLVYVSSNIDNETNIRNIEEVMNILKDLGFHVDKFTSDENKQQREYIIDKLTQEIINGIVAIKCLDEGVDVPSIEHAFILASSSNPKEFIQRRGRVLRKSKGKKFAYIYDFLVVPDLSKSTNSYDTSYLKKELERFLEFSSLAENRFEAEDKIMKLKEKFGLLHL
ncbi:DEAD/DEAH box helicase family protein [Aliarcobacter butzleri]